jgi:hypothetical protein
MYRSWTEVRDGFAKNIIAGHGDWLILVISALAGFSVALVMAGNWLGRFTWARLAMVPAAADLTWGRRASL